MLIDVIENHAKVQMNRTTEISENLCVYLIFENRLRGFFMRGSVEGNLRTIIVLKMEGKVEYKRG